jgi:hypothetical protein
MKVKYSAWSRDVDDARVECESDWRADVFAVPLRDPDVAAVIPSRGY